MRGSNWAICVVLAVALGCAVSRRTVASPQEYGAYRAARSLPTLEGRLGAACAYLQQYPEGAWAADLEGWFATEEAGYWTAAYGDLARIRTYRAVLPTGPHADEAERRQHELELAAGYAREREARFERRAREITRELDVAARDRRAFVAEVAHFAALLVGIRSWGRPTSELESELIHRWRIQRPMARCVGGRCVKTLSLDFAVPAGSALDPRRAVFDVVIELERGGVARAIVTGPELWSRLAEALTLRPVQPDDLLGRLDAVAVAMQAVENAIEGVVPAARCGAEAISPAVLVRSCDGVRATMIAAPTNVEEDRLVVEPDPIAE